MPGPQGKQMLGFAPSVIQHIGIEKKCSLCGGEGVRGSWCRSCRNKYGNNYYRKNKEKLCLASVEYKKRNKDKNRGYQQKWRDCHKEEIAEKRKVSRTIDPDRFNLYSKKYNAKKRKTLKGRLSHSMSNGIYMSLSKKTKSWRYWADIVGYTLEQLKKHLEGLFTPGMLWDNYGKYGWHIDHIVPISSFNYEYPEDIGFKKCWALENLQPLWATDNLRKHNKILNKEAI